jgi:linearmycin/streptolysin S transport system ATP-binding protein
LIFASAWNTRAQGLIMPSMLSVRGLRKSFGARVAVDSVGFAIAAGEIYGLLGPNGAGKTTSISMIAGILARDDGEITIDGINIDAGPPARALIGIVPQAITVYLDLTARENLDFWGRMYDLRGDTLRTRVEEALSAVGLTPRAGDIASTYSGGMQRRLNLACGILHRPKLLILDEPTVGVDPQSRSAIFDLVERLRNEGTAILYTTHYMEEAERLCARIGIIDAGKLIAEGTRSELVANLGQDARIEIGLGRGEGLARAVSVVGGLEGVRSPVVMDDHLNVFADRGAYRLPALLSALLSAGLVAASIKVVEPNLEDVFLRLTGRALRD